MTRDAEKEEQEEESGEGEERGGGGEGRKEKEKDDNVEVENRYDRRDVYSVSGRLLFLFSSANNTRALAKEFQNAF